MGHQPYYFGVAQVTWVACKLLGGIWTDTDNKKIQANAKGIIAAANIAFQPSLTSNHLVGKAVDWSLTWDALEYGLNITAGGNCKITGAGALSFACSCCSGCPACSPQRLKQICRVEVTGTAKIQMPRVVCNVRGTGASNFNANMWQVGATYGVIKQPTGDRPHWSINGR